MVDDSFSGLSPINFFQISGECHCYTPDSFGKDKKKHALPDTSELCYEESFADINLAWAYGGLHLNVVVNKPYLQAAYPNVTLGDSVEIFIDTRDVKSSGYNTRFCHHFFFLPETASGKKKKW